MSFKVSEWTPFEAPYKSTQHLFGKIIRFVAKKGIPLNSTVCEAHLFSRMEKAFNRRRSLNVQESTQCTCATQTFNWDQNSLQYSRFNLKIIHK